MYSQDELREDLKTLKEGAGHASSGYTQSLCDVVLKLHAEVTA